MTQYATAEAFRQALEARLAHRALERGVDLGRLRRQVVMERILVRLEVAAPGTWVLKGGTAMELRLPDHARATLDLDLAVRGDGGEARSLDARLRDALGHDAEGDRFVFEVTAPRPLDGGIGEATILRYTVGCRLAGRRFVDQRVDVSSGVAEVSSTERLLLPNLLGFDGFPDHAFETVAATQHFAEKLHALTRDYGRENTRTRDLIDLVLLIEEGLVSPVSVGPAVALVFRERATHPVPDTIPEPPTAWDAPYARMAGELGLDRATVPAAMALLRDLWALVRPATPSEGPA